MKFVFSILTALSSPRCAEFSWNTSASLNQPVGASYAEKQTHREQSVEASRRLRSDCTLR